MRVMHLAEVGLRVTDLPRMAAFYQDVLGLTVHRAFSKYLFLRVGPLDSPLGRGGHPQLLVLFDREVPLDVKLTTIDHLAFEIPLESYESERQRLEALGLRVSRKVFDWLGGRSLFFEDPDGNTIELIAHDPTAMQEAPAA